MTHPARFLSIAADCRALAVRLLAAGEVERARECETNARMAEQFAAQCARQSAGPAQGEMRL
jgi:hypothetical protein